MKNKNESGFSLVELLVVVIIIGIIAAIAIPSLLASRRAANEASAIASLRSIHSAQITHYAIVNPPAYAATPLALFTQGLIDPILGSGTKSGYTFAITQAAGTYCATGAPTTAGTTGTNYYGVGVNGVIYRHTAALTCASGVLTVAGSAIE